MNKDYRKISELKLWDKNPRSIKKDAFGRLKSHIQKYGQIKPVIIDGDGVVLGGNMRLKAYQSLGINEVWVSEVEANDEKSKVEIALIDNDRAGYYEEQDLAELVLSIPGLDLEGFGIDIGEPALLKDVVDQFRPNNDVIADELPNNVETRCQSGDIWELGRHRVMCGDSTKIEDVERLMDGKRADMVFTDPPYGVSYASKNEFLNNQDKGNRIQTDIKNDTMSLADTEQFIYDCFVNLRMILAEKSSYYITAPQGGDLLMMMMMMMQKAQMPLRHMIIWVKNNHVLGRTDYNYKHEPILYGWVNTHNFYGKGPHRFSTWEVDKPHKSDLHPTMKPIELVANALLNSTLENELVTDIFLGSGSTLIACEQTNRICYGMELDPHYCDVIIQRWENFTGKTAKVI